MLLDSTKFWFKLLIQKIVWNENLKNDPPHISSHLPFESGSLLKC
jgi:hypothetical protein